ncbi:AAA family ATPase [Paraburkholderia phenoliruptrix]|uniref:AAA family ATPase n=1 Tax=Paraburkholderia phenoliruptrix TaxID=252970 RepID=UPI0001C02DCC|nr:AAA family ATPase [Paraburkholderia phenoliruptrix]MDR6392255.1 putative ATPase [Paraburkholderia phenoliruptrix]
MNEETLRIRRVEVTGLFGLYNHKIDLNLQERVTIIHGPNGVGKTMLLKLVAALFSGRLVELARTHFSTFTVTLTDASILGFEREEREFVDEEGVESDQPRQQYLFERSVRAKSEKRPPRIVIRAFAIADGRREEAELGALPNKSSSARLASFIDSETPWLYRMGPDQWMDREYKEYLTAYQVIERYSDRLPTRYQGKLFKEPELVRNLRRKVKVHFIETQRLLKLSIQEAEWARHNADRTVVSMVKSYASELKEKVSATLANYGKGSQTLDQSFPWRLLHGDQPRVPVDELKRRMVDLEKKRDYLKKIGLLADDNSYPFDVNAIDSLDSTRLDVLALYVSDTQSKLSVLDNLSERVYLLLDIVNKKFRNKSISLDKQEGLKAVSSTGASLDLDALSSGEQHELVLIYDLLFRVDPDTLVLLDEPELSLHLTWQKQFLQDLLNIVEATRFDAIVATHSPFIVGDRHDLMVPLASQEAGE